MAGDFFNIYSNSRTFLKTGHSHAHLRRRLKAPPDIGRQSLDAGFQPNHSRKWQVGCLECAPLCHCPGHATDKDA